MDDRRNAACSRQAHGHVQDPLAQVADAAGTFAVTHSGGGETLCSWFERLRAYLYKQIALEEHDVFLGRSSATAFVSLSARRHSRLRSFPSTSGQWRTRDEHVTSRRILEAMSET